MVSAGSEITPLFLAARLFSPPLTSYSRYMDSFSWYHWVSIPSILNSFE
jgi:hypothetical protein